MSGNNINTPVYLPDIFSDIVDATRVALQDTGEYPNYTGGTTLNYNFGHPLELVNLLQEKVRAGGTRFPAVFLIMDTDENRDNPEGAYYAKVNLELWIWVNTKDDWDAAKRYTEKFKPILYPIYYELLHQIVQSRQFHNLHSAQQINHIKTDRFYYGKQELYGNAGNIDSSYVDAITVTNLELKLATPAYC